MIVLDLRPAARHMTELLDGVADDQLAASTPCADYTLGELIGHVGGLSFVFTAAAVKDLGQGTSQGPSADGSQLGGDWRTEIPERLAALAEAWRDPGAWEGMTQAGGLEFPADVAGQVALNEVVIHGWDVARASGQPFHPDTEALEACMKFVSAMSVPGQEASREGLFGPVVEVPADAPLLDRVLGLSGRDPAWTGR